MRSHGCSITDDRVNDCCYIFEQNVIVIKNSTPRKTNRTRKLTNNR